ncbi:YeeE/YedE thiosulfate transporter family protein [Fundidesulfovibrio agrisoli]|uniref:YeeE/YedE thiosulfate transporter family protein n=1 Tax=Fundidesulfovibrio agrisoli TaxID=2922717 RepID=UPI001FACF552|nr:YeeE/YedE thiosulfate transporter family protein [Fundidesulfovibrio agrisoli]
MSDTDKEKDVSPQAEAQAAPAEQAAPERQPEQVAPEQQPETPRPAAPRLQVAPPQDKAPMNPYLAGVLLGLTLMTSYLILGAGLGASGALARLGAVLEHALLPARAEASAYFGPWFPNPLSYYLVFMLAGVFAGGLVSAASGGRMRLMIERGPTASRVRRLALALIGGVIAGFASRLAQGCTSGQGLSGGAVLLTGSFLFMGCLFATGYLTAWIFRRQWT